MQNTTEQNRINTDILLVDDSEKDLQLLSRILTDYGFTVRREKSGETALAAVITKKPDLIFLAARIPGVDGFEVCRRLKADQATASVPVVFIASSEKSKDKAIGFKTGGDDFISKPYQPEDILVKVNYWLENVFLHRELEKSRYIVQEEKDKEKSAKLALQLERERLNTALLAVSDAVICTDKTGCVTMINEVAMKLTGLTAQEAIGQPVNEVFYIVNQATREKGEDIVKIVLATGKPHKIAGHVLLINRNRSELAVNASAVPFMPAEGNIEGAVLTFRDCMGEREKLLNLESLNDIDQLTGLCNRRVYDREIERLESDEKYFPLTFIIADVNGLGLVNNAFGYRYGDIMLKKVAKVLKNECRSDDVVTRIGEDKFVILLPCCDEKNADIIISRINQAIAKESVEKVALSLSVGFSIKRDIYDDMEDVFRKAEDAMYRHKLFEDLNIRRRIIFIIMNALFEKNEAEKPHAKTVSELSERIAIKMGLRDYEIKQVKLAGLVHDIGKIGIDESILRTKGTLNSEDWEVIKRHPETGYRILSSSKGYSEISNFVLDHHERWDGKGYPRGLKGEEISVKARIIAVADAYADMIADRSYKKTLTKDEAAAEIIKCAGTQFDPVIARIFIELVMGREFAD